MDHGKDVGDGDIEVFAGRRVGTETHGRSTDERSDVVGGLNAAFGVPDEVVAIGEDGRGDGGAVVPDDAHHHETMSQDELASWFGTKKIQVHVPGPPVLALGPELE